MAKYNFLCFIGTIYCLAVIATCSMFFVVEPVRIVLEIAACLAGLYVAHVSEL